MMEEASSALEASRSPYSLECIQGEILIPCGALASPTHVQTMRYGLSHIHHLLEEDDPPVGCNDESCNLRELVAYHAKASEFAAILKEDSPALSFNLTLETLLGTPSTSGQWPGISYPGTERHVLLAHDHFAECPQKKLQWMNSSGLPRRLALPTPCMSSKFLEDALYQHVSSRPLRASEEEKEEEEGPAGDIHVNFGRGREEVHRMMNALNARKENGLSKVSGKYETSHEYVDLGDLLVRCAQAIGSNNTKAAMEILVKVKQHASPYGSGEQRLAYYFAEALEARVAGTGWPIYLRYVRPHRASPEQIWKASSMYMSSCPFAKSFRFFANQTILDVAKGALILHIVEYQMTGFQYPSLFKALAARPGGPPQVRLIGVNAPHYSMASIQVEEVLDRLEEIGRHMAACAASCGVPFHFTAWAGATGSFPLHSYVNPNRNWDEVFVVLSAYPLRYISDDLLHPPTKRSEIFKNIRHFNPEAYIQGIVTGSYNTPFFSRRFREALSHFERQYDMLDTFIDRENKDRSVFESEILGKAVLNIVACEETNVVERVDNYKQRHASTKGVGLEEIPVNQKMKKEVQKNLKSWHKEYMVIEDLNYLLMGWKGCMLHAIGAWKGSNPSRA